MRNELPLLGAYLVLNAICFYLVSKIRPSFETFTAIFFDLPFRLFFGTVDPVPGLIKVLFIVLSASLALSFFVLIVRKGINPIYCGIISFFVCSAALLSLPGIILAFGILFGFLIFSGSVKKPLDDKDYFGAGSKIARVFLMANIFAAIAVYVAFSSGTEEKADVLFDKLSDQMLEMTSLIPTQNITRQNAEMLADAQRMTIDASFRYANAYLLARGDEPIPQYEVEKFKSEVVRPDLIRDAFENQTVGLEIKDTLRPILYNPLKSFLPVSSALALFFVLEFLRIFAGLAVGLLTLMVIKISESVGR